ILEPLDVLEVVLQPDGRTAVGDADLAPVERGQLAVKLKLAAKWNREIEKVVLVARVVVELAVLHGPLRDRIAGPACLGSRVGHPRPGCGVRIGAERSG